MRVRERIVMAVGAIGFAGCGGADAGTGSEWAGTIQDSAGVTIVTNGSTGTWTDESRWQLEDVLRIGEAEGDPDYQFGLISGIGELSDGRIMVLDQQAQDVRIFSPDGVFEQRIGKAGSGPGEFGAGAAWLSVVAGDTVFIVDPSNRRVNLLLGDGTFHSSFPLDFQANGFPVRSEARQSGHLISQFRQIPRPDSDVEGGDAIVEFGSDGTILDTVLTMPSGGTFRFRGGQPEIRLFSPEPSWTLVDDDGLAYAVNDKYRIETYGSDGALRRVISRPSEEVPITDSDESAFMEGLEQTWARFGMPDAQIAQIKSQIEFADVFPVVTQFRGGPGGSVWVQRLITPSELLEAEGEIDLQQGGNLGGPNWDVFDGDGRFLGQVTMPDRYQPVSFVGDRIYGVWRDEFDVQYVRVLRVAS